MLDVLLVEDNEADALLVEESFRGLRGVRLIHVARDGFEALTYLRREGPYQRAARPHLVLLDINMPRMDGYGVLEAMKSDPALQVIPVVVLTTSGREEDVAACYRSGANSYVHKPADFQQFAEMAARLAAYWSSVCQLPRDEP